MVDTSADATRLSPWWRHSAILVMIAGFSVLSIVTVLTYTNAPPIPEQVTDVTGSVLFTGADIQMGQEVFLKYGLMEHGSLWGHGAYLGPDYSAEYLHRLSEVTLDTIATERYGKPFALCALSWQSSSACLKFCSSTRSHTVGCRQAPLCEISLCFRRPVQRFCCWLLGRQSLRVIGYQGKQYENLNDSFLNKLLRPSIFPQKPRSSTEENVCFPP